MSGNSLFHDFPLTRDIVIFSVKVEFTIEVSKNYDFGLVGKLI